MKTPKRIIYRNKHISTILPSLLRKEAYCPYVRERVYTKDGDFFDVDWIKNSYESLVVLLHGLEGSSSQHYVRSQADLFSNKGFDIAAINFRSCSGEMNQTTRLYHSGETEDLDLLVNTIRQKDIYKKIFLIGFSLGANVSLKYLGEKSRTSVDGCVAFSAPIDLRACSYELASGFSRFYSYVFMSTLRKKVKYLQKKHKLKALKEIKPRKLKTFLDFDELITAPLHGFKSAEDYWAKSSSKQFLGDIKVPTLIVNAKNDPFLSPECYPSDVEINNSLITTIYPEFGGHVGFIEGKLNDNTWMELKAYEFIQKILSIEGIN
jgi:predicted alpha/beta-fold hydrolase